MSSTSVFENQTELLATAVELYLGGDYFEADLTFGNGSMHKALRPEFCADLSPKFDFVKALDVTDPERMSGLQFRSILFDPPFLCGGGQTGIMHQRFSSFKTAGAMFQFLAQAIENLYGATAPGGFVVFKCQDLCNARKQYFSHCEIYRKALSVGFYARDLLILVNRGLSKPTSVKNPAHVKKQHSYFWIFEKKPKMRNDQIEGI